MTDVSLFIILPLPLADIHPGWPTTSALLIQPNEK